MKKKLIYLVVLCFCIGLFVGCATTYQAKGFSGGYSDVQLDKNTIKVSFKGNGHTSKDTVDTYLLYRCAETTVQHGYDYFVIVGNDSEVKQGTVVIPGSYQSNTNMYVSGNYGTANTFGTYMPPQAINYHKYGATATIKMFQGEKPDNLSNAYTASTT